MNTHAGTSRSCGQWPVDADRAAGACADRAEARAYHAGRPTQHEVYQADGHRLAAPGAAGPAVGSARLRYASTPILERA